MKASALLQRSCWSRKWCQWADPVGPESWHPEFRTHIRFWRHTTDDIRLLVWLHVLTSSCAFPVWPSHTFSPKPPNVCSVPCVCPYISRGFLSQNRFLVPSKHTHSFRPSAPANSRSPAWTWWARADLSPTRSQRSGVTEVPWPVCHHTGLDQIQTINELWLPPFTPAFTCSGPTLLRLGWSRCFVKDQQECHRLKEARISQ